MAGPNQIPGPTAIRAPTPTIDNHQTVLTQLKETTETAQRLRGNPLQSYATLGELISAGIIKFLGGVVSPGDKIAGAVSTVHVADSIQGSGSTGSPLQLVGDSASPGNSMLYGTNGSGAKGWYAQGAGLTSPLTTKGDLWTFSTLNTREPVGVDGQILMADSTQTTGIKWATSSAGSAVLDLAHGGGNIVTPSNSGWTLNLNGGVGTATFGANGQLILNVTTLANNATYRKTYGGGNFDIQWYVTNTPSAANFPTNFTAAYGFFVRDPTTGNMISCGSPTGSMSALNLLNLTTAAGATIGAVTLSSNVGTFGNGGGTLTLNVQYGWGRLTRVGNAYTFYVSIDGINWLSLGSVSSSFAAAPTQFGIYMFTTGLLTFWSLSGI